MDGKSAMRMDMQMTGFVETFKEKSIIKRRAEVNEQMQAIRRAASQLSSWKFRDLIGSLEDKIDRASTCDDWITTFAAMKTVRQRMEKLLRDQKELYVFFTEWCVQDVLAMFIFCQKNSYKELMIVISGGSEESIQEKCSEARYLFPGSRIFAGKSYDRDIKFHFPRCEWIPKCETPHLEVEKLDADMFGMIFVFGSEVWVEYIGEIRPDIFKGIPFVCPKHLGGYLTGHFTGEVTYASEEQLFGRGIVKEIINPVKERLRRFPNHPVYKWFTERMDAGDLPLEFEPTLCVMCWMYMGDYEIPEQRGFLYSTPEDEEVWEEDEMSCFTYTRAENHDEQIQKFVEQVLLYLECNDETIALFYMELFDSFDPVLGKHEKFGDMALHLQKRFKEFREREKPFAPHGRCDLAWRLAEAYVEHAIRWMQTPNLPDIVEYDEEIAGCTDDE